MTKEEIYLQSLSDLAHANTLLISVLREKEVSEDEQKKIYYSLKLLSSVVETQKYLNSF